MGKKEGRHCSGAFTPKRKRPSRSNLSGKLQDKRSRVATLLASTNVLLPEPLWCEYCFRCAQLDRQGALMCTMKPVRGFAMTKLALLTSAALLSASAAFAQSAGTSTSGTTGNATGSSTGNVMTSDTPSKGAASAGSNAEQQQRGNAAQTQSNSGGSGAGGGGAQ